MKIPAAFFAGLLALSLPPGAAAGPMDDAQNAVGNSGTFDGRSSRPGGTVQAMAGEKSQPETYQGGTSGFKVNTVPPVLAADEKKAEAPPPPTHWGAVYGTLGGIAIGALIGAMFGPIGILVGAMFGAVIGAWIGKKFGKQG